MQHENQLRQLHTSLFFDHQRNAFAGLLAKIAEVNQIWLAQEYDSDEGFTGPVPYEAYRDLRTSYFQHQLFLDTPCLAAMELIFEFYRDSFRFDDGSGAPPRRRDERAAFGGIEYLQPRLAALFQQKIGVSDDTLSAHEIALLGAIRLINQYHFAEIGLPVEGPLQVTYRDSPVDAVAKAENNRHDLVEKLKQLQVYLKKDGGFFHEAATKLTRYLSMLEA